MSDETRPPVEGRYIDEDPVPFEDAAGARQAWLQARLAVKLPRLVKDTQGHGYQYAALNDVLAAVEGPLREQGLSIRFNTWSPTSETLGVRCVVTHVDGWSESAEMMAAPAEVIGGRMSPMQMRGAFITYACRYTLLCVLGTTADVDTDAAAHDDPPPRARETPYVRNKRLMEGEVEVEPDDGCPF